ncbi:DNA-processing protein DprA [Acetobacterium bakii]|uniref:DNA-processing protein DprA n=1 Tax=Acetobacterium bakii TaxID=52689 RepID=UPI0006823EB6|nr:DNA-processing protein DprA [Acetobacterium bakii]
MDEKLYWLWFMGLEKITLKQKNMMLDRFNFPKTIFSLSRELMEKTGILKKSGLDYFSNAQNLGKARESLAFMESHQIDIITRDSQYFPESLNNIYMPPLGFFAKGDLALLKNRLTLGIVGSRNPTIQGEKYARGFAQAMAAVGITIISGMAAGIDGESHWGSLNELGNTIGVLGTGVDQCYPRSNQKIYDLMSEKALLISEFYLGEKALPFHFPLRNRIISGLSQGVLIIEARKKSGSLITANHALEQGKNVYVIPGDISSKQWAGGNQLLKEGAMLVTEPRDILEDYVIPGKSLSMEKSFSPEIPEKTLSDVDEKKLYQLIRKGYTTIDQLVLISGLPVNQVNSVLTMMEIDEVIKINYGNIMLI